MNTLSSCIIWAFVGIITCRLREPIYLQHQKASNIDHESFFEGENSLMPNPKGRLVTDGHKLLVDFWAMGRRYKISTTRRLSVIPHTGLKVLILNEDGSSNNTVFKSHHFDHFEGKLVGTTNERCYGYYKEGKTLSFAIQSSDGMVFIKTSTRNSTWYNTIVSSEKSIRIKYSHSEKNLTFESHKSRSLLHSTRLGNEEREEHDYVKNEIMDDSTESPDDGEDPNIPEEELTPEIMKRRLIKLFGTFCPINVVIHSSVLSMYNNDVTETIGEIVHTYCHADQYYFRKLDLDGDDKSDNLGIKIMQLVIMMTPYSGIYGEMDIKNHYDDVQSLSHMLKKFRDVKKKQTRADKGFCAEHLLVNVKTKECGHAYNGDLCVVNNDLGVINLQHFQKNRERIAFILMHETAHIYNDVDIYPDSPESAECRPSKEELEKGIYVDDSHKRNRPIYKFTACNADKVYRRLMKKAPFNGCFKMDKHYELTKCGNLRIDKGEECDSNLFSHANHNSTDLNPHTKRCCAPPFTGTQNFSTSEILDKPCHFAKLAFGAVCDPAHSPCCDENCLITKQKIPCNVTKEVECIEKAGYCNGKTAECTGKRLNGVACKGEKGICINGVCMEEGAGETVVETEETYEEREGTSIDGGKAKGSFGAMRNLPKSMRPP